MSRSQRIARDVFASLFSNKQRAFLMMLGVFLGLNLSAHFDIDRRQGLRLGAGLNEWTPIDEPVPV